jgi:hypothetical protein
MGLRHPRDLCLNEWKPLKTAFPSCCNSILVANSPLNPGQSQPAVRLNARRCICDPKILRYDSGPQGTNDAAPSVRIYLWLAMF